MPEERTLARGGDRRITTGRLSLRPPVPGDAGEMAKLANDRQIAAMLAALPHPYRLEDARRFIGDPGREIVFAVVLKAEMRLVGVCGLRPEPDERSAELGTWIGRPHWGLGYATEAVQAVIDFGFRSLRLEAIHVRCRAVNEGSRRVIRKCGFQFCGPGMIPTFAGGSVAGERYVMDRRCWQSLKAWGLR